MDSYHHCTVEELFELAETNWDIEERLTTVANELRRRGKLGVHLSHWVSERINVLRAAPLRDAVSDAIAHCVTEQSNKSHYNERVRRLGASLVESSLDRGEVIKALQAAGMAEGHAKNTASYAFSIAAAFQKDRAGAESILEAFGSVKTAQGPLGRLVRGESLADILSAARKEYRQIGSDARATREERIMTRLVR